MNNGKNGKNGKNKSGSSNDKIIHNHSQISKPAYEPGNPLQVINWMSQSARKYSTISIGLSTRRITMIVQVHQLLRMGKT